jgi:hypothetical protein
LFRQLKTLHKAPGPWSLIGAALAAAIIAAPASGQSCKAPPGMSAIDQYCEAIPAPGGDRGNSDADRGGRPISAAARHALERRGADGKAIIALSAASPKSKLTSLGGLSGASPSTTAGRGADRLDRPSDNPFAALASGFTESGNTVGPLFGTVLLFFALVFFATAWLRYRRRAQS